MLYKKNIEKKLSEELFKNPTSEYRGTPFWALNSHLETDELCRQIDIFKEMGLGGFHLHVRTGLENEYLGEEYMSLMKDCVDKAKNEEMLAWLYDEDRWPSGAAGGLVTKEEKFRGRNLLFSPFLEAEAFFSDDSRAEGGRSGNGKLLACYDVVLDEKGFLESYKKIDINDNAVGSKWYAFLEINSPSPWYNMQTYADTLNKEAIEKFIEVTHEKYKTKVGNEFDKTVPAIFTDEPQFTRKKLLNNSFDKMDITMPWTDNVPDLYKATYGEDIFDTLPELFWDLKDSAPSIHRYRYHDFIAELFASSFADTIGTWCKENNIALTGHMMEEPTLRSQTAALGEAMRSYRNFQLPGIDMLCNSHEYTTAKQAQSAVHQYGYEGMLSELYGVTGWDCDFRTYKHQGDWQACLGVTIRVPHLSWYAMKGEAKRDYPASIHYQSPWYKKYNIIEDHFARVNTALTRGKPIIKVGVIHPVESFWLHWGPNDKSGVFRESLDEKFKNITNWLIGGSIDFNYIAESLLPSLCEKATAPLKVGKMEYDAIVVPGCETLRSSTLQRLKEFKNAGGKLIFMGDAPTLIDAKKSDEGKKLAEESINIDFTRAAILTALEDNRTVTLRFSDGRLTNNHMYQLRQDGDCKWLFVVNTVTDPNFNIHTDNGTDIQIIIEGTYIPEVYDTINGTIYPIKADYQNGKTVVKYKTYSNDSVLLKLTEGKSDCENVQYLPEKAKDTIGTAVNYELSEDNVLLLDMAEYKLDGEAEFSPEEEVLRLDNVLRQRLGIRERKGSVVQPWVVGEVPKDRKATLKYTFESEINYSGAVLALEEAQDAEIVFNGQKVDNNIIGTYVDIAIFKVALPDIKKGTNTLEITWKFGERANLESVFILGKFGVTIAGCHAKITALPEKIYFGNLVPQGFPFYGGAVTYKTKAETKGDTLTVTAGYYFGALLSVIVDGEEKGDIVYPPYTLEIKNVTPGVHDVDIKAYLHRYNTFGPLHLSEENRSWHGPDAWRSAGAAWSYEYVLRRTGIHKAPGIK